MGPCIWLVSRPKPYLMAFIYALVVSGVYAFQASLLQRRRGARVRRRRICAFGHFKVPFLPMVLGVVLGFMVESNYRRALVLSMAIRRRSFAIRSRRGCSQPRPSSSLAHSCARQGRVSTLAEELGTWIAVCAASLAVLGRARDGAPPLS